MQFRIATSIARSAALALTFAIATPAFAQVSLTPVKVVSSVASRASARADTLEQRAAALMVETSSWKDAAKLYRTAGELRKEDPRAALSFRTSAWLYAASGDRGQARRMLARAAERSAESGDAVRAAHTYIDAAFAAAEDGRVDLVAGLINKARILSGAEVLSADQQLDILRRLPASALFASR